jgi:hypothetical protein
MSSGEDILIEARHVRGQDVRMIHIPACISDFDDIFDADDASTKVGKTVEEREQFVSELEARTREFQGCALLAFLHELVNDNDADRTLARYMGEFVSYAPLLQSKRIFARLRRRIAACAAGTTLACDYRILPFTKQDVFQDFRKCMNDALDLLIANESKASVSAVPDLSDHQLVADFRKQLVAAKFLKVGRYANRTRPLTQYGIETADAFIKFHRRHEFYAMIPTRRIKVWYPEKPSRARLVALLRKWKIFSAGRQADTAARQTKISPYPTKIPYYRISLKALGLGLKNLVVR